MPKTGLENNSGSSCFWEQEVVSADFRVPEIGFWKTTVFRSWQCQIPRIGTNLLQALKKGPLKPIPTGFVKTRLFRTNTGQKVIRTKKCTKHRKRGDNRARRKPVKKKEAKSKRSKSIESQLLLPETGKRAIEKKIWKKRTIFVKKAAGAKTTEIWALLAGPISALWWGCCSYRYELKQFRFHDRDRQFWR